MEQTILADAGELLFCANLIDEDGNERFYEMIENHKFSSGFERILGLTRGFTDGKVLGFRTREWERHLGHELGHARRTPRFPLYSRAASLSAQRGEHGAAGAAVRMQAGP
jgi:hypothetical protein